MWTSQIRQFLLREYRGDAEVEISQQEAKLLFEKFKPLSKGKFGETRLGRFGEYAVVVKKFNRGQTASDRQTSWQDAIREEGMHSKVYALIDKECTKFLSRPFRMQFDGREEQVNDPYTVQTYVGDSDCEVRSWFDMFNWLSSKKYTGEQRTTESIKRAKKKVQDLNQAPYTAIQSLGRQLGNMLACVHATDITHMDMHDENLLVLSSDSTTFRLRVIDWGLSEYIGMEATEDGYLLDLERPMKPCKGTIPGTIGLLRDNHTCRVMEESTEELLLPFFRHDERMGNVMWESMYKGYERSLMWLQFSVIETSDGNLVVSKADVAIEFKKETFQDSPNRFTVVTMRQFIFEFSESMLSNTELIVETSGAKSTIYDLEDDHIYFLCRATHHWYPTLKKITLRTMLRIDLSTIENLGRRKFYFLDENGGGEISILAIQDRLAQHEKEDENYIDIFACVDVFLE